MRFAPRLSTDKLLGQDEFGLEPVHSPQALPSPVHPQDAPQEQYDDEDDDSDVSSELQMLKSPKVPRQSQEFHPDALPKEEERKSSSNPSRRQSAFFPDTPAQPPANNTQTKFSPISAAAMSTFDLETGTVYQMRPFVTRPIPKNITIKCYIIRKKPLVGPQTFEMYLEPSNTLLMTATRKVKNQCSVYSIHLVEEVANKSYPQCLGTMKSNEDLTNFILTDAGTISEEGDFAKRFVPREYAAVVYLPHDLGTSPRTMATVLPPINKEGEIEPLKPLPNDEMGLIDRLDNKISLDDLHVFRNRRPRWDPQLQTFILKFHGRVTDPSIKNFILETPDKDREVLLFGRAKKRFNMNFEYPFSPLQAFAISLSVFDCKLA